MASYRASVKKNITRSAGQSVVNSAAYITREKLLDKRINETFNYSKHQDKAIFTGVFVPKNAPEWARTVEGLANGIEEAEGRKDSQLGRPIELNLPHELTLEQNKWILQDFIRDNFTRKGYAVIAAIHEAPSHGDNRNTHAHLIVGLRTIDENGFSKDKKEEQENFKNKSEYCKKIQESWANIGARHLDRHGFEIEAERWRHGHEEKPKQAALAFERGDLEFFEKMQGEATKHLGHKAAAMERDGIKTERGEINREIEARNEGLKNLGVIFESLDSELEKHLAENTQANAPELDASGQAFQTHPENEQATESGHEPENQTQAKAGNDNDIKGGKAAIKSLEAVAEIVGKGAEVIADGFASLFEAPKPPPTQKQKDKAEEIKEAKKEAFDFSRFMDDAEYRARIVREREAEKEAQQEREGRERSKQQDRGRER